MARRRTTCIGTGLQSVPPPRMVKPVQESSALLPMKSVSGKPRATMTDYAWKNISRIRSSERDMRGVPLLCRGAMVRRDYRNRETRGALPYSPCRKHIIPAGRHIDLPQRGKRVYQLKSTLRTFSASMGCGSDVSTTSVWSRQHRDLISSPLKATATTEWNQNADLFQRYTRWRIGYQIRGDSKKIEVKNSKEKVNKLHYISYIMIFFASCRGQLEKSKVLDRQHHTVQNRNYAHGGLRKRDTSTFTRLWHFYTDSNFRYHADSGLMGNNGWVTVYESGWQSSRLSTFRDSIAEHTIAATNTGIEEHQKRLPDRSYRTWLLIILLAGAGYLLFRIIRINLPKAFR